ncbi:hypothetical protein BDR07DRAFT_1376370 [Suillus spraguei]|nr:hypothetical protein BDR07DRAFT_1376370 [Suillus spraguei]
MNLNYIISLVIGTGKFEDNLIVDNASMITWVGASTPFKSSTIGVNTGKPLAVKIILNKGLIRKGLASARALCPFAEYSALNFYWVMHVWRKSGYGDAKSGGLPDIRVEKTKGYYGQVWSRSKQYKDYPKVEPEVLPRMEVQGPEMDKRTSLSSSPDEVQRRTESRRMSRN